MASFNEQKLDLPQINNGQRLEDGNVLNAETLNRIIEGVAYLQPKRYDFVINVNSWEPLGNRYTYSIDIPNFDEKNCGYFFQSSTPKTQALIYSLGLCAQYNPNTQKVVFYSNNKPPQTMDFSFVVFPAPPITL